MKWKVLRMDISHYLSVTIYYLPSLPPSLSLLLLLLITKHSRLPIITTPLFYIIMQYTDNRQHYQLSEKNLRANTRNLCKTMYIFFPFQANSFIPYSLYDHLLLILHTQNLAMHPTLLLLFGFIPSREIYYF